jgi:acyl-CoA oxidase
MSKRIHGSVKNQIVASDLQAERANCNFDQEKMRVLVHGGEL